MKEDFHFKHYNEFNTPSVHKSLMETSEDNNKKPSKYMTSVKTKVIDFDEVKKNYMLDNGMHEDSAKSVDALYMTNKRICMTEFKNGDFSSSEIIEKVLSSVMIFTDITDYSLSEFRKDAVFILVYNPEVKKPNHRQRMANLKAGKAKKYYSLFQLDHLRDFCFGEVVEIEKDEFSTSDYVKGIEAY